MDNEPLFYILKYRLPASETQNLLGRFVKHFNSPLDVYTPEKPAEIFDSLPVVQTTIKDAHLFIQSANDKTLKIVLQNLLSFGKASSGRQELNLGSSRIKTWRLRQREDVFKALIANDAVKRKVLEYLPVGGKLYMIVGMMTCEHAHIKGFGQSGNKVSSSGTVPVSQMAALVSGVPVSIPVGNIEVQTETLSSADWSLSGKAQGAEVFAVEYRIVKRPFVGFGKSLSLAKKNPHFNTGLTYGVSDDEDEESDSDGDDNGGDGSYLTLVDEGLTPSEVSMEPGVIARIDIATGLWYIA